jgi:hypothetical protein
VSFSEEATSARTFFLAVSIAKIDPRANIRSNTALIIKISRSFKLKGDSFSFHCLLCRTFIKSISGKLPKLFKDEFMDSFKARDLG